MSEKFMIDIADNQLRYAAEVFTRQHHPELSEDCYKHSGQVRLYFEFAEMMEAHYKRLANHFHREACNALNLKLPDPFIIPEQSQSAPREDGKR